MLRNIIKYGGLALVIIGIILVMKNLFNSDSEFKSDTKKKSITTTEKSTNYTARISLKDKETGEYLNGANITVKDEEGNNIASWVTTNDEHLVPNLKNGTYTIVEDEAPENYKKEEETKTFKIKNKNKEVTIYNIKMTEEEIEAYEEEERQKNTIASEVGVDNTLSEKSTIGLAIASLCFICGISLLFHKKEA